LRFSQKNPDFGAPKDSDSSIPMLRKIFAATLPFLETREQAVWIAHNFRC
jgi:hypothetical protein